jgi:hypothetical protein
MLRQAYCLGKYQLEMTKLKIVFGLVLAKTDINWESLPYGTLRDRLLYETLREAQGKWELGTFTERSRSMGNW